MSGGGGNSSLNTEPSKVLSLRVSQSTYGTAIPRVWGTQRLSGNLLWYGDFEAVRTETRMGGGKGGGGGGSAQVSYTYRAAMMIALCSGPIAAVPRVWIDKEQHTLASLGFELKNGALGQSIWSHLTTHHASEAVPYSGIAFVASSSYDLGDDPSSPQWSFEVVGERATSTNGDADPADVIYDIWADDIEGAALDPDRLGALDDYRLWCKENGFTVSLLADAQTEAREAIQQVLDATLSVAVPSQGKIKFVPLGDQAVGDWVPDTTPVYDITEDDLLEAPKIKRQQPREATNKVTVEYASRDDDYNAVPVTSSDITHVNLYGAKTDTKSLHCITRGDMASAVAAATLNRGLYIRSEVELKVDQRFCLLEPMDLITLTFGPHSLTRWPLRVKEIEESEEGDLTITAEEWPFGVAQPAAINTQGTGGYVPNYNVKPGNANTPVILEPPVSLAGQPEIWLGTSGGSNWGGAEVWISLDDETYSKAGNIASAARHGVTTAAYPYAADPDNANTLDVDLSASNATLMPVTQAARDLYESLCWVGNSAGGELVAYQGATLTGVNRYELTNCRRGAHGTHVAAHPVGSQFLRIDGSQFRYAYNTDLIGKTLYIKLRSYNRFGSNLQDLADVSATTYVVKGAPLGTVANFVLESPFSGLTLATKWDAYPGATAYELEIWYDGSLKKGLTTTNTRFSTTIAELVSWGVGRTVEFRLRAVSANGQSTDAAVLIATKAQIAAPTVTVQDTASSMIVTASQSTDAAYKATRICISKAQGFDPASVVPYYDGPQTAYPSGTIDAGTWYIRVAQYDHFGPDNLNWSSEIALGVVAVPVGVQRVADASAITAAAGSEPPGGDAYWAVYDLKTQRMWTWIKTAGKYEPAPSEGDVEAKISAAVVPALDDIADLQTGLAAEAAARAAAISEEANARATALLQEQLAREAAITTTQTLQQSADQSLAAEIAQVAAGTGDQFDPVAIWYFKGDFENWYGLPDALTIVDDTWLRPCNHADASWANSPVLNVDGAAYRYLRGRIKRVGNPTWTGYLQWSTSPDSGWAAHVEIDEPVFKADGTGTIEADNIAWAGASPHQISIRLGSQSDTDYYLIDWIAIGRPTPGAGVAALESVRQAMVEGDAASALKSDLLAAQLRGDYTGTASDQLTQGLMYDVRKTAVDLVGAEAQKREALTAEVAGKASGSAVQALETRVHATEQETSSQGSAITRLQGEVGKMTTWVLRSAGLGADHRPALSCPKTGASYAFNRSYNVARWADDGSIVFFQTYDTCENGAVTEGRNADTLAADIQAMPHGALVAVLTWDEPATNLTAAMLDAIESLGGTRSLLTSLPYHGAYLLVGRKGFGPGSAVEKVAPVGDAPNAWVEYDLQFVDGRPLGIDGAAGARAVQSAQATALESLSQKVTQQGNTLTAQADHLQQLDAHVGTAQGTANAAVTAAQQAQATADGKASASSVEQISARLNDGGDIKSAIVQIKSTADATEGKITASWGLVLDVNNKISGVKNYNDGSTSSFQISADKIILGDVTNLCRNGQGASLDGWTGASVGSGLNWPSWWIAPVPGDTFLNFSGRDALYGSLFPVKAGDQYWCESDSVSSGGGASQCSFTVGLNCLFSDGSQMWVGGATRPAGTPGGYHASGALTIPAGVVSARVWVQNDKSWDAQGIGWDHYATHIVVRKRATTEVLVPGCVTAEKVDTEYTRTTILQAKQAVIDYLAVKSLSAVCASIGDLTTTGWIIATGNAAKSYGGIRSANDKWWADGKTGFALAYKQDEAESFFDLTAKNSYLKLSSWGDNQLHFADASGNEMLHVDSAAGTLRVKGRVEATSGAIGGLVIDSDGLRSSNYTAGAAGFAINKSGAAEFDRTSVRNPNVVASGTQAIAPGWVGSLAGTRFYIDDDGTPQTEACDVPGFEGVIDTGVSYPVGWNAAPSDIYGCGLTISSGLSYAGGCNGYMQVHVEVGCGLLHGTTPKAIQHRVYIRYKWTWDGAGGKIQPQQLAWKLVRL